MPLDCLDNVIGINRTCTPETPISGLYIQDLPGIELKVADAIVGSEYASGVRFLKDKISFAKNLMLAEIRAQLQDKLKISSVVSNQNIGYVDYNSIINAELNKYKGIQINVRDYPYFELYLQSVSVFANETKTIDVFVYDLITGTLFDTIEVTTVANAEVNVLVNKTYYSQRKALNLFICTDSDLGHYQAKLNKAHCPGCTNTINNAYTYISYREITQGNPIIERNLQGGQSTGGISVSYSLTCSLEPLMCNMASILGMPLLFKAGYVIMNEALNTGRLNPLVLTKKEDWEVLRGEFEKQYLIHIRPIMGSMKMPNDICFECNRSIKTVVQIP